MRGIGLLLVVGLILSNNGQLSSLPQQLQQSISSFAAELKSDLQSGSLGNGGGGSSGGISGATRSAKLRTVAPSSSRTSGSNFAVASRAISPSHAGPRPHLVVARRPASYGRIRFVRL